MLGPTCKALCVEHPDVVAIHPRKAPNYTLPTELNVSQKCLTVQIEEVLELMGITCSTEPTACAARTAIHTTSIVLPCYFLNQPERGTAHRLQSMTCRRTSSSVLC